MLYLRADSELGISLKSHTALVLLTYLSLHLQCAVLKHHRLLERPETSCFGVRKQLKANLIRLILCLLPPPPPPWSYAANVAMRRMPGGGRLCLRWLV